MRTLRPIHLTVCLLVPLLGRGGTAAAAERAAAERAAADRSVAEAIDRLIGAGYRANGVVPAAQADDATLVRRLTLDLVGRIPTWPEVERYAGSSDPDKRAKLVDALMATPGYGRYQATLFDAMLGYQGSGKGRGAGGLRDYLNRAVAERRPWDRVFRELLLPDDARPDLKGASEFLRPRAADGDRLTNDVSVSFFGVNVSCAQCHDHPLVKDWTQDHYYGMKSFLARTFEKNGAVGERAVGAVKFKPNKGAEKVARMMFLTGAAIDDPSTREPTAEEMKAEKGGKGKKADDRTATLPPPAFSARAKLVEVALRPENAALFDRSIVNRVWHRLFDYGLVNPLDQMHAENPPSHPELLSWLARDLASHGYDLDRLVRGIALSASYSRDSRYPSDSQPEPRHFAVARLKPLTPVQLATSLKLAAQDPACFEKMSPAEVDAAMERFEASSRGLAALIAQPTDNFQIGVGEALLFSNGKAIAEEYLVEGKGTLLGRMAAAPDRGRAIELAVRATFGRGATPPEREALAAYLERRGGRAADANRQVLWALCTGPEFRFNH